MPDRILVTGGAGFVGSAVCLSLKQTFPGSIVVALDNLQRAGSQLNLPRLQRAGVRFVRGDVRMPEDLAGIGIDPDLIVECSAEPSAQAGYGGGSPAYLVETNLFGCFHCLEVARRTKADFVFISTSRVYPFRALNELPFIETASRFDVTGQWAAGISESFPLQGPRSLYGMSKLSAEYMVQEFADAYGFRAIVDRCGLLTGPWQMAKADQGVIALWAAAHVFGRPLQYIGFGGKGKQVRDFLHIADFCELLLEQIARFDVFAAEPCWNVGGGPSNSLSLLETTAVCEAVSGRRIEFAADPVDRPADVRVYVSDCSKLFAKTQWRPRRDATDTIADLVHWVRENETQLRGVLG
jgi:CDP-paratose 2-epimerase